MRQLDGTNCQLRTPRPVHLTPIIPMDHIPNDIVDEALSLIHKEDGLPHPFGPLLQSFIKNALQPKAAATLILRHYRHADDQKAALLTLASDWTYIVESCKSSSTHTPNLNLPETSYSVCAWYFAPST